jgi:6-phosphogluconolactonase
MGDVELNIYPDPDALYRAAADTVMDALRADLCERGRASFVLAGGHTPRGVYDLLGSCCEPPDWDRVEFFWGDERCVPPDDENSNFLLAQSSFLSRLAVPERNIHRIQAELKDVDGTARSYEEEIRASVQGMPIPRFDLVLLGMGDDGHTASLFPGAQWDGTRLVISTFSTRAPFRRISLTPRLLNAAQLVVFLVSGQAKAQALKRVLEDPDCDLPARSIQPSEGHLVWMVDRAAASLLAAG